jgi:hypothetical protein
MNTMLATEPPTEQQTEKQPSRSLQETWAQNERMRHIPSVEWLIRKLDGDLRRRVEKLLAPIATLPADDPRRSPVEQELRALCGALDRVADVAKHSRHNGHAPADLPSRVGWSISHAVTNLRTLDPELFGRRFPFQTFERSKAEPLYGAFLTVVQVLQRIVPLVRAIDPNLDERLMEGIVVLENPVDQRMLRPIA